MESQAGGRDGSNVTSGDGGVSSSAGRGLRIARPVAHRIESAESHEGQYSPSIQDILVALPADFDPLQPPHAPEGSAGVMLPLRSPHVPQFGGARRLAHPYLLPEHRQRSVSVHSQPDHSQAAPSVGQVLQYQQQLTSAAAALSEQLRQSRSGFAPDGWSQRDQTPIPAAETTYNDNHPAQRHDTQQRQQPQKRRRVSKAAKAAKASVSHRQGKVRLSAMPEEKEYPEPSTSQSPSSVASEDDDDGTSLARALTATRSQIDAMAAAPANTALDDLEVHSKRKRPSKQVKKKRAIAYETSSQELPRPPLHAGSGGGAAADTAIEEKPAVLSSAQPPVTSEPQLGAIVTVSGDERPPHQATCRVSWCTQPGRRFGLCWTHGGVKKCCESNCARVALETSEFCSFHQPKHSSIGRTASI